MNKVAIIGSGGAGKSTLARALGKSLNLPVYHLDAAYWKPGWVPTPNVEWDKRMEELVQKDHWIIDGNYSRTFDIRLREADSIIYLDFPTFMCLFRAMKRRIQYWGKTRPDMAEGCMEKIDLSFIRWILNFRRVKRPGILKKLSVLKGDKKIYILTSAGQVKAFLAELSGRTGGIR